MKWQIRILVRVFLTGIFLLPVRTPMAQDQPDSKPDIQLINIVRSYSDRQPFNNPTGIYLDAKRDEIYLADSGNGQISVFDMEGTSLFSFHHWVTGSTGERILGNPTDIVVLGNGDIIVSDGKADYLEIFDFRGNSVQKIPPDRYEGIETFRGAELAIDKQENLYVGLTIRNCEIIKLNKEFEIEYRFGTCGDGPEKFNNISGIWVSDEGNIYVTDVFSSPVIKIFDSRGRFIKGIGGHSVEKIDFSFPSGIVITKGGRIWICDSLRQVVKCIGPDGNFITMIGGFGTAPGDMRYPADLASDGDSLLFVAEKNGNRYQQFIIK